MKNFTLKLTFLLAFLFRATLGMAQTTYQTVGIVGSATTKGWETSTPMTQGTGVNAHRWTITIPLKEGEVKFRANDNWDVNWGAKDFPSGTGTQGGANIVIPTTDTYAVEFNDATGAYKFTKATTAGTRAQNAALLGLALAPNPAQGALSVMYDLPTAAAAAISVQNLLGQSVRQFSAVRQAAGQQEQRLSLQGLAAGLYVVRLQAGAQTQTARLVVE
jgi:hypothetical protein